MIVLLGASASVLAEEGEETHGSTVRHELKEIRQQSRSEHRLAREAYRGDRKAHKETRRSEYSDHKEVCREQIAEVESDEEKVEIREECKAEAKEIRDGYKEDLKELKKAQYDKRKSQLESRLGSALEAISDLPEEHKDDIINRISTRLDELDERAMDSENDDLLLIVEALRDILLDV